MVELHSFPYSCLYADEVVSKRRSDHFVSGFLSLSLFLNEYFVSFPQSRSIPFVVYPKRYYIFV